MTVEQPFGQTFQRTAQKQRDRGESNSNPQHDPMTEAADEAKHRDHPNRRGRRQAGNVTGGIPHYDAGAEETDAGQDSLDDAAERVGVGSQVAVGRSENENGNGSGAKTDERVGAEAGWFSVQLAV